MLSVQAAKLRASGSSGDAQDAPHVERYIRSQCETLDKPRRMSLEEFAPQSMDEPHARLNGRGRLARPRLCNEDGQKPPGVGVAAMTRSRQGGCAHAPIG